MHTDILSARQVAVLELLKAVPAAREFYLAGGTALALRHGHRRSIDFDFFRRDRFEEAILEREIEQAVEEFERLPSGAQTVYLRLCGVTASFFRYPYPQLDEHEDTSLGFSLASDADIAAMKIEAISGRGSRKDFIDLYMLCASGLSLERVLVFFDRKFGTRRSDHYHRLRALTYFEDAEREPMPDMLVPLDWDDVKGFFTSEATGLLAAGAS